MKYIMFRRPFGGCVKEFPIIFPTEMVHSQICKAIQRLIKDAVPVSAGEATIDCLGVNGHSETLSLNSREQDVKLITFCDYGVGIV